MFGHELESKGASTVRRKRFSVLIRIIVSLAFVAVVIGLLSQAGSFLIMNSPEQADVIVVLEGAEGSYQRAVRLQRQGFADKILLDARVSRTLFGRSEADLAGEFLNRTSTGMVQVCPTLHDSTFGEAEDVKRCLERLNISSVLLVTGDFHTRVAVSIFRKRLPQYRWSVAASSAPYHDADQWWQHRAWAKTVLDEWNQYVWWQLIDRERRGVMLQ